MSTPRLAQLQKFYEEDPRDPFNVYGLALEYLKHDVQQSRKLFEQLLTEHPNYLPVYYHAAKLYQELNERKKAISVYEKGMEVAGQQQDFKTRRELQSAYDELMFEH